MATNAACIGNSRALMQYALCQGILARNENECLPVAYCGPEIKLAGGNRRGDDAALAAAKAALAITSALSILK